MNETNGNFFKPSTSNSKLKSNNNINRQSQETIPKSSSDFFTKKPLKTFGNVYDNEYLYNENINLKNTINKKNCVINELKFNNTKLKVIKLIHKHNINLF